MRKRALQWVLALVAILACGGAFALAISRAQSLPSGVVEIIWDKDMCAHCRMHVGDPSFGAQLQTKDGRVLNFDDPGCLLRYEIENRPEIHAIWVHEAQGTRWLARDRVAFRKISPTPMGYGFGAVEVGTSGSMTWDSAREEVRQRAGVRREK